MPEVFEVAFLERAAEPGVIFGSKAVGEPPLMLAISVREAIRDAIAAFGAAASSTLDSPATPERIFWAMRKARAASEVRALAFQSHEHYRFLRIYGAMYLRGLAVGSRPRLGARPVRID